MAKILHFKKLKRHHQKDIQHFQIKRQLVWLKMVEEEKKTRGYIDMTLGCASKTEVQARRARCVKKKSLPRGA